jgi:uncharacterized membrane protein
MQGSWIKAGARKLMIGNAPKLFFVSIVYIVITTILSELEFRLPGTGKALNLFLDRVREGLIVDPEVFYYNLRASGIAFAIVLFLFQPIIEVGYIQYCMKISRGQDGGYKDIFDGFYYFAKILLIGIISAVFILLWSMLFIIPGAVAFYRYRQAYYILLDAPEKSALQCIRESKQLMRGNKLDLFLLDLSFFGWFLLNSFVVVVLLPASFAIPIVSIWLMPYLGLTRAAYYDYLINKTIGNPTIPLPF